VAADAAPWLAPGGHLVVETGQQQAPRIVAAVARGGLLPQLASCPDLEATVVIGTR
jgi:release factor glutamine methyltransferase